MYNKYFNNICSALGRGGMAASRISECGLGFGHIGSLLCQLRFLVVVSHFNGFIHPRCRFSAIRGRCKAEIYCVSLCCCSVCRGVSNSCQDGCESTATVVAMICHDC